MDDFKLTISQQELAGDWRHIHNNQFDPQLHLASGFQYATKTKRPNAQTLDRF